MAKQTKTMTAGPPGAPTTAVTKRPHRNHTQKLTQYEIRERRYRVQKLRLQGKTIREIAAVLSAEGEAVSPMTVSRDLQAVQEYNLTSLQAVEQDEVVADALARYMAVEQEAWARYNDTTVHISARLRALDLIRTIQRDKLNALLDTGLLHKADQTSTVVHTHKLDWSPEMQESVAAALMQQQLRRPLLEPVPEDEDCIDVDTGNGTEHYEPDDDS